MKLINEYASNFHDLPEQDGAQGDGAWLSRLIRAGTAQSPAFSTLYAFGDSLSDAGNVYINSSGREPATPPYSRGRFSNGRVWLQDLAQTLGLPVPQASLNGGTDYAYGGAETGQEALHNLMPADLPSQLLAFQTAHPAPAADALYTLSVGTDDLLNAISAYGANPTLANQDVQQATANETQFVQNLIGLGAQTLVILNVPDLGKTPDEIDAHKAATATSLSAQYDAAIAMSLGQLAAQDHVTIDIVDTFSLIDQIVSDPQAFGFRNATTPVWTGNAHDASSGTLNAHGTAQNQYLFFDHLHPTAAGHDLIASSALSSLALHG